MLLFYFSYYMLADVLSLLIPFQDTGFIDSQMPYGTRDIEKLLMAVVGHNALNYPHHR